MDYCENCGKAISPEEAEENAGWCNDCDDEYWEYYYDREEE